MIKFPYTTRPEDVVPFLQKITGIEAPTGKVGAAYIDTLGFSRSSGRHLLKILKNLGFLNEQHEASSVWLAYAADEKRGSVLASALKRAYEQLFETVFCPYLESDENLLDYFKVEEPQATTEEISLTLETFHRLCDLADFQDLMCVEEPDIVTPPTSEDIVPEVKVNPNLQLNIQIHIDPNTSEEKIEAIFRNMQKYLLGKGS
jgi:hypothetical protein